MSTPLSGPQPSWLQGQVQSSQVNQAGAVNDQPGHPEAEALRSQISEVNPSKNLKIDAATKIEVQHLNFYYGPKQALFDVSLPIREHQTTALIGPSGCGKTTFLRTLNRMNDLIPGTRTEGEAMMDGQNIYDKELDVVALRQRVGMVFQRPNPFPKSIFENVAYGLRIQGRSGSRMKEMVEESLKDAALWDEVKDRLNTAALSLSGGQQQRLCIARALEGGESDLVSSHHVYNVLAKERPDVLKTLTEPNWYFDRKGETSKGQEEYIKTTVFYLEKTEENPRVYLKCVPLPRKTKR